MRAPLIHGVRNSGYNQPERLLILGNLR
jgi:hypothetical protein